MNARPPAGAPGHSSRLAERPAPGACSSASPKVSSSISGDHASAGAQGVQASVANGCSPRTPSVSPSGHEGGSPADSDGQASAGASTSVAKGDSARSTSSNQVSL